MVPIHRYLPGQIWIKNTTVWDKEVGPGYVPKNADDFKRILQALTKPQQDFYGIGGAQGNSSGHLCYASGTTANTFLVWYTLRSHCRLTTLCLTLTSPPQKIGTVS